MTNKTTSAIDLVERLRTAFQQVQRCKRGDAPLDMRPVWDIINAVPEVVALLSNHAEFEQDLALEGQSDTITRLQAALKPFVRHYEFKWMDERPDEAECCIYSRVTYGQLREAVAALSSVGGE